MSEYSSAIALAKRLITKKGRSGVSVYRPSPGTASNPSRPWKLDNPTDPPSDTLLVSGLHVLFLDVRDVRGAQGQFGTLVALRSWAEMPDSIMPNTTSLGYIIPDELSPYELKTGDLLVSGTNRFVVLRSDPLKPGNELIMYVVQLKE